MANDYLDDHEQSEAVQNWLKENGSALFIGVVLGLGGILGWQYYERHQENQALQAATYYSQLDDAGVAGGDVFGVLQDDHGSNAYAALAALRVANDDLGADADEQARAKLEWVVANAEPKALRAVAAVRLARVQLADDELDTALQTVAPYAELDSFKGLVAQVRGDVFVARQDYEAAADAYALAMENLAQGADRTLLQIKINNLPKMDAA